MQGSHEQTRLQNPNIDVERLSQEPMTAVDTAARDANAAFVLEDASPTLLETIACVTFLFLGNGVVLSILFFLEPHKRPMPIQYLETSAEYVRRLSNDETYEGETLHTATLMILFCVLPIIIQL